ncbi:MAG TPA: photosystem reaction center subunit H [Cyanobacteria bacterium UBA11369]|nr:photosystem reaction center subunit H [Cyanobacteria bacterium UBA11371]HBE36450.1 photosystem reaction center subunit H [Cyanobacteria bacterium UBA11368]HBE52152.1 photosystem reaction center subunit H [Cyanobacteria bacterium UBA11369]
MTLIKLDDFYPNNRDESSIDELKNFSVYAQGDDKVGSVSDILVDEQTGRLRYFVVDTGFWVLGKKVLLPIGLANVNYTENRIYANSLTKEQVENLPDFSDLEKVDYDYEEQVRGVYRPAATSNMNQPATYDRNTYNYEQEPSLYNISDRDNQTLKLYEERLVANKQRHKAGEVAIGKRVETQTARVAVPVEKERVVIERTTPTDVTPIDPRRADFNQGDVIRMDIYEETPDIHKETVVREEVKVKKVVDRDTATAEETIRREELDLDTQGRPIVEQ